MKPIIGVFTELDTELNTKMQNAYGRAIEKSGGIPVILPYVEGADTIEGFVKFCDGFVFTGGADVDPRRYGEQPKSTCEEIQYARDELEFKALQAVMNTSKPILCICRGAQLVNVMLGGTLYQDIPSETGTRILHRQTEPKGSTRHNVKIFEGTRLFDLIEKTAVTVNSFHHQAIKKLGDGLEITAVADDGIVESFSLPGKRYLCAYQWHPEQLYDTDTDNRRIFDDFIEACR